MSAAPVRPAVEAIRLSNISGGYGQLRIVREVDLTVLPSRTTALLGPNGAGKSTLVKLIMGVVDRHSGSVSIDGADVTADHYSKRLQRISWVPEGRPLFDRYTVDDNLRLAGVAARLGRREIAARVAAQYELFPEVARRHDLPASSLSGGERQMLALARALMRDPTTIVLDEPSIGLAPLVLERLATVLAELRLQRRTLVICEQNTHWLKGLIDDVAIMSGGRIVSTGGADLLDDDHELARHYIGNVTTVTPTGREPSPERSTT